MTNREGKRRNQVRHDLKFNDAAAFGNYISIKLVAHESLHPAWHAFQNNIESIWSMMLIPDAIVNDAIEYLVPLVQAIHNVAGKPVLEDDDHNDELLAAIESEYADLSVSFIA